MPYVPFRPHVPVRSRAAAWLLAGVAACALPAQATPSTVSIGEAVRLATANAPSLDARRARVAAAREDRARAGALPDPMLMVGIDNLPVTGAEAFDPTAEAMTMKRIGLRQDVPARAERQARRVLASRAVDEARATAIAERLVVQREAAQAWVASWTAEHAVGALEALRDQAVVARDLARARVAGGEGSVAVALAVESEVLAVEQQLEDARAERAAAQAALARWIAVPDARADPAPAGFARLPVPEAALLAALDRAGALLAIDARADTVAAAIDLAQAERSPDWSIAASYGQRDGGRSDMLMLEFGIQLPLFRAGRQDRDVAARRADHAQALAQREDARRALEAEVRAAIARWQGLARQVARDETELLPLQRDRTAVALAAFHAGATASAWLDARRDEIDAVLAHVRRQGELGRLWASLAYLLPEEDVQ